MFMCGCSFSVSSQHQKFVEYLNQLRFCKCLDKCIYFTEVLIKNEQVNNKINKDDKYIVHNGEKHNILLLYLFYLFTCLIMNA